MTDTSEMHFHKGSLKEIEGAVEPMLDLLNETQRMNAKFFVLSTIIGIHSDGLGEFFAPDTWFDELNDAQRQQVIDYYHFLPNDIGGDIQLTWYADRGAFRREKAFPVVTR